MHAGRCQPARGGAYPTPAPRCPAPDRRRGAHHPSARAHSAASAAARKRDRHWATYGALGIRWLTPGFAAHRRRGTHTATSITQIRAQAPSLGKLIVCIDVIAVATG